MSVPGHQNIITVTETGASSGKTPRVFVESFQHHVVIADQQTQDGTRGARIARPPEGLRRLHFAIIRSGRNAPDPQAVWDTPDWAAPVSTVFETGPARVFFQQQPVECQARLLAEFNPDHILGYPSHLAELAWHTGEARRSLPRLRAVRTYGERVSEDVRQICRDIWSVEVEDSYSSEEVGCIALQCHAAAHYHVQSETVLVEILDARGQPCAPGRIGRVVVTVLHNFVFPLIRYDTSDYAEAGADCPGGRGLPVITRLIGRQHNLALTAAGHAIVPHPRQASWRVMPTIERAQRHQRRIDTIDIRVQTKTPLPDPARARLRAAIAGDLGHLFKLQLIETDHVPRHPNGKSEACVCGLDWADDRVLDVADRAPTCEGLQPEK